MRTGKYRHYKGKDYEVMDVVCHSETNEKMVLYRALYECPDLEEEYGIYPLFVRPYNMFFEELEYNGEFVPRFQYIG